LGLEKEIKFFCPNIQKMDEIIGNSGGKKINSWYFEKNMVFDRDNDQLLSQGRLLRLRITDLGCKLTFKSPAENTAEPALKVMREWEVKLDEPENMVAIFSELGYSVRLRYEKFRKKWIYQKCVVCLDILPFGRFMEIEGDYNDICDCAANLGLDPGQGLNGTYFDLYKIKAECPDVFDPKGLEFSALNKQFLVRELNLDHKS